MRIGWRDGLGDWPATPETEIGDGTHTVDVDSSAPRGPSTLTTGAELDDITAEWRDGLGTWATH